MTLAAALVLSGCGGAPGTIGPSGVDQLEIPTPSPDPADFVDQVDNRWLPLPAGATWIYRAEDAEAGETATIEMAVSGRRTTIAGVATTVVEVTRRSASGRVLGEASSSYAQDRAGNVWLLSEESPVADRSWRAAVDGAEAGVAMPALPRLGDGFWRARVPGVTEQQARVESVAETVETGWGALTNVVVLELSVAGAGATRWYAPGIGLVAMEDDGRRFTLERSSLDPSAAGD